MKRRIRIKIIKDTVGDLPKALIGRYGVILRRKPIEDEFCKKAYLVQADGYRTQYVLFNDEFKKII